MRASPLPYPDEVAVERWGELLNHERPLGAIVGGLITVTSVTPLLVLAIGYSLPAWGATLALGALLVGTGVRKSSAAVTGRYGFFAVTLVLISAMASMLLTDCGQGIVGLPKSDGLSNCWTLLPTELGLVLAAILLASLIAFFSGYRRYSVHELLEQLR